MGSQINGFITIEQTVAKRGEDYAGIINRQNITVAIVLRETNKGTVDRGRLYPLRCAPKRAK